MNMDENILALHLIMIIICNFEVLFGMFITHFYNT